MTSIFLRAQGEIFYNRLQGASAWLGFECVACVVFSAKAVTQEKVTNEDAEYEVLVLENTLRPEVSQLFFQSVS